MSRYIDTEWLADNAKEYSLGYYEEDEWATPLSILDSAPSIDIVRCKECKYEDNCEQMVLLSSMCGEVEDTRAIDFCSYGERRA